MPLLFIFLLWLPPKGQASILINDADWPPFFYKGKRDKPPGFAKEIIQSCFDNMRLSYRFQYFPIRRMRLGLEKGTIDVHYYSYKKARESFLIYGKEEIFQSSYQPVVLADSKIQIDSIKSFDKYRIGHQIGLRYSNEFYNYIQERKKLGFVDESPSDQSNIFKLIKKRIDVFVGVPASVQKIASDMGVLDRVKVLNYSVRSSSYFINVSKASKKIQDKQGFVDTFDKCIKAMKKSGAYCKILGRYSVKSNICR